MRRVPDSRGHRGQALVELALLIPVLMVLAIGALDFGMAFYVKIVTENSAREGAYYMVYNTDHKASPPYDEAKSVVQAEAGSYGVDILTDEITVECAPLDCPSGSTAKVRVEHHMDLLVKVIFHGPITVSSEARMLIQ
jgi:Flp pilus assembly protein TadG